jgi:hypothetical protein
MGIRTRPRWSRQPLELQENRSIRVLGFGRQSSVPAERSHQAMEFAANDKGGNSQGPLCLLSPAAPAPVVHR